MVTKQARAVLTAATYGRVSTDAQEREGTSLETQEEACRALAAGHGYRVAEGHVYRESHSGSELWDRPRLTALRDAIRQRLIDAVIVYETGRLSRDPVHLLIIAEECAHWGVALIFVQDPVDTSDEGRLMLHVKGFAAKLEREKIRERQLRAKYHNAQAGKMHNHGVDLYGYRRDKQARRREVRGVEAGVVLDIYHWVVEGRQSVRAIARRLNERATPPPSAGKLVFDDPSRAPRWGKSQIHRILREPAYKGESWAWRYRSSATNAGLRRPEDEWVRLPDDVTPAIVPPPLWQAAQERLTENAGEAMRNEARAYLLRGRVFCAVCGARMYASPERGKRMYRCSSREKAGGTCGGARVPADAIEGWVWGELAAAIRDPALIAAQRERETKQGPDPRLVEELEARRQRLTKVARQQERWGLRLREIDPGDDGADALLLTYEREIVAAEGERRRLQGEIAEREARLARRDAASAELAALESYCAAIAGRLESFEFDDKRLALEAFAVRVEANGGETVRDWHLRGSVPIAGVVSQPS